MCGICGFVDLKGMAARDVMQASIDGMNRTLLHRGPDLQATWVDEAAGTALDLVDWRSWTCRRLAISR